MQLARAWGTPVGWGRVARFVEVSFESIALRTGYEHLLAGLDDQ
jgi:hypothetical protein